MQAPVNDSSNTSIDNTLKSVTPHLLAVTMLQSVKPSAQAVVDGKSNRRIAPPRFSVATRNGKTVMQWSGKISGECKTAAFALSEALTAGLSKTRFVVWWSELEKKFVPGRAGKQLFDIHCASTGFALMQEKSGVWAYSPNKRNISSLFARL